MKIRGTVNGQDAVIDLKEKQYIPVTELQEVRQTNDGKIFVVNSYPYQPPVTELSLLPADLVAIPGVLSPTPFKDIAGPSTFPT